MSAPRRNSPPCRRIDSGENWLKSSLARRRPQLGPQPPPRSRSLRGDTTSANWGESGCRSERPRPPKFVTGFGCRPGAENNAGKLPILRKASIFTGRRAAEHSASPPKPLHQQLALGDGERFGKAHHRLFEARAQNRIRASDLL
jgi:hypothetical protein